MSHPHLPTARRRAPALATAVVLVAAGLTAQAFGSAGPASAATARQVESLDRGVISVRSGSANLVSWRLSTDPSVAEGPRAPDGSLPRSDFLIPTRTHAGRP